MISSLYQALWYIDRMGYLDTEGMITTKDRMHMASDFEWHPSADFMEMKAEKRVTKQFGTMGKFGY